MEFPGRTFLSSNLIRQPVRQPEDHRWRPIYEWQTVMGFPGRLQLAWFGDFLEDQHQAQLFFEMSDFLFLLLEKSPDCLIFGWKAFLSLSYGILKFKADSNSWVMAEALTFHLQLAGTRLNDSLNVINWLMADEWQRTKRECATPSWQCSKTISRWMYFPEQLPND